MRSIIYADKLFMNIHEFLRILKLVLLNKYVIIAFCGVILYLNFFGYILNYTKKKKVAAKKKVVAAVPKEEKKEEKESETSDEAAEK
jgi:hypothetical protein